MNEDSILDDELDLDYLLELEDEPEKARRRLNDVAMEKLQEEFVAEVNHYMRNGGMPRRIWTKLPRKFKLVYRERFKGTPGHTKGVPMSQAQKDAKARAKKKRRQKGKAAKAARKANR